MATKKTDISQIKDYLEGGLGAHAMHKIERRAQDDPFLMDAIDGYEKAGMPTQLAFDELGSQLQRRINKGKPGRVIQWRYFAVAASLFILFSIGWLLWPTKQSPLQKQQLTSASIQRTATDQQALKANDTVTKPTVRRQLVATFVKPKVMAIPDKEADPPVVSVAREAQMDESIANADMKVIDKKPLYEYNQALPSSAKKDSITLKEVSITGLAKLTPKDIAANASGERQSLQGKVNGADFTAPQKISGTVLNDLGMAMPGVNVKLQGTDVATLTDEKGRFSVPANGQATLDIEQSGFVSKRITAGVNDSVKVELQSYKNESAAGMVLIPTKLVKVAHPQMGSDAYDKYLQNLAVSADGVRGIVRLSFSVSAGEGQRAILNDFKIIRGLSDATNQQAISLIKNGPAWVPDVSGKTKTVEWKVKFRKK